MTVLEVPKAPANHYDLDVAVASLTHGTVVLAAFKQEGEDPLLIQGAVVIAGPGGTPYVGNKRLSATSGNQGISAARDLISFKVIQPGPPRWALNHIAVVSAHETNGAISYFARGDAHPSHTWTDLDSGDQFTTAQLDMTYGGRLTAVASFSLRAE